MFPGSKFLIGMFDANGNSGGVPSVVYTIAGETTGANASCITMPAPAITVNSNATSKIESCDSVQLFISGGTKPYTVSVAESNTVTTQNFSMGPSDNTFTWVNNLSPGNVVIRKYLQFDIVP
jgi:hypothetical protein